MYTSCLTIDTKVKSVSGPTSSKSQYNQENLIVGPDVSPSKKQRSQSVSDASTSSSASVLANDSTSSITPVPLQKATPRPLPPVPVLPHEDTPRVDTMESEYVLAMHDYEPQQSSTTCLSFRAGQVIHVFNRDSSGWWDGELEGRRGWFPSNYVNVDFGKSNMAIAQAALANAQSNTESVPVISPTIQHRRQSAVDAFPIDAIHYSAPVMIPMVHALSLLQNAVRANRISHFQPSAACIIACVRRILNTTETINRNAPVLQRFPTLAQERSRLLTILAKLVAQARRASDASLSENELTGEIMEMLKTGGLVFSQVRRFIAVVVQCGIELPENGGMEPPSPTESLAGSSWQDEGEEEPSPRGVTPTQRQWKKSSVSSSSQASMRAKSMADIRNRPSCLQSSVNSSTRTANAGAERIDYSEEHGLNRHKVESSISSTSSSSSSSSQRSLDVKSPPPFPSGSTTSFQVLDALRSTHDQYLSTIAAFIGHAHSYSRSSHASSTGHLYELTRDIVRMVERILTIVVAVMSHADIPTNRVNNLRSANEALYAVASKLTDSIRRLTVPLSPLISEEEEKAALIRSATSALKAGADCVAAVRVCLNRVGGERPFILNLPSLDGEEPQLELQSNRSLPSGNLLKPPSVVAPQRNRPTQDIQEEEEEMTIHPELSSTVFHRSRELSSSSETSGTSKTSRAGSLDTVATSPTDYRSNPLMLPGVVVEPDLPSPVSWKSGDDVKTTWEGSTRMHDNTAIGEKMLFGELPQAPLGFDQDPENWMYSHDYSLEDVAYNSEGHLVGATLEALVEKMTPHDVVVDSAFSAVFFMTFRLFTSPTDLVDAIIARYNLVPPNNGLSSEELLLWQRKKGLPVRLRVSNFIKQWVELYWKPGVDDPILPTLMTFTKEGLWNLFPAPAQRLYELLEMRKHEMSMGVGEVKPKNLPLNRTLLVPSTSGPTSEVPRPNMTKALLMSLRKKEYSNVCITDFDALELARQITVMECTLYCAVQPAEILEAGQQDGAKARSNTNVKAVSSLSTVITGWVAESILDERDLKRRTLLIKFFIKVADRCTSLHNYSTSRSILAALDSSTIARLHQTWAGVPHKSKTQLEALRKLADHSRNYHEYRSKLRNTCPPAVPFLGLYLTDVTFCREGNPSYRVSPLNNDKKLLNFNKYNKLARIVQDMQRFQVLYNLKAIPEVQDYLNASFENSKRSGDFQDLYRRSLLVEPKQPADTAPTSDMRQLFNWAMRSQSVTPAS